MTTRPFMIVAGALMILSLARSVSAQEAWFAHWKCPSSTSGCAVAHQGVAEGRNGPFSSEQACRAAIAYTSYGSRRDGYPIDTVCEPSDGSSGGSFVGNAIGAAVLSLPPNQILPAVATLGAFSMILGGLDAMNKEQQIRERENLAVQAAAQAALEAERRRLAAERGLREAQITQYLQNNLRGRGQTPPVELRTAGGGSGVQLRRPDSGALAPLSDGECKDRPTRLESILVPDPSTVVDLRCLNKVAADLIAGVPELAQSPAAEQIRKGYAAVINRDWTAALAWWRQAQQMDPGNRALKRSIELAEWTIQWAKEQVALANDAIRIEEATVAYLEASTRQEFDAIYRAALLDRSPQDEIERIISSLLREMAIHGLPKGEAEEQLDALLHQMYVDEAEEQALEMSLNRVFRESFLQTPSPTPQGTVRLTPPLDASFLAPEALRQAADRPSHVPAGSETTMAYLRRVKAFCDDRSPTTDLTVLLFRKMKDCELQYAAAHKNDDPPSYIARRNAEHYLYMRSACDGRVDFGITTPVATVGGLGMIPLYSGMKLGWNLFGQAANTAQIKAAWTSKYATSPPSIDEMRWAYRGVSDCWFQMP